MNFLKFFIISSVIITLITGCKTQKYGDLVDAYNELIGIHAEYLDDLKSASDADDYKEALIDFANSVYETNLEIIELEKKYPELKDQSNIPAYLESTIKNVEVSLKETERASMNLLNFEKINDFKDDPEFAEAMVKLGKTMLNNK
jgi:hypothetical protein